MKEQPVILSIVIVNWNTRELLFKCLESVYEFAPTCTFEVLLVDNASSDGSAALVSNLFPQVRLFANQENCGFARGNNQAIREARGEYVLLLNPDTEVKENALDELVNYMIAHPWVGGAGSLLLNPDGTLQASCHPEPTLSREFWRLTHLDIIQEYGDYDMSDWNWETPRKVDVVQGASLILRGATLEEIGLLDEDYFIYTEEVDLCYRMRKAGWGIYWVPTSRVIHYGGQSTKQMAQKMFLKLYESRLMYFRKNHGAFKAFLYKLVLMLAALIRIIGDPIARIRKPEQTEKFRTLAHYYRDLLLELPRM